MIEQLMRECNNFFDDGYIDGDFSIVNGVLSPADGIHAAWVAICGSTYHDGVYRIEDGALCGAEMMFDDHFAGRVYLLHPPTAFIALANDIDEYVQKTPVIAAAAESFGAYSITYQGSKTGGVLTWQEAFSKRLKPYRHMFTEVPL